MAADPPPPESASVEFLVRSATVRVAPLFDNPGTRSPHGTAFFVTRNRLFTCSHVLAGASRARLALGDGSTLTARVESVFANGREVFPDLPTRFPDLAVLTVDGYERSTWAMLSTGPVSPENALHTTGFPTVGGSSRNPIPTAFKAAGRAGPDDASYLKGQGGGIGPGNSGGPVYGASQQNPMPVVGWMVATNGTDHYLVPWASLDAATRAHPVLKAVAAENPPSGDEHRLWTTALFPSPLPDRLRSHERLIDRLARRFGEMSASDSDLHAAPDIPARLLTRARKTLTGSSESVLAVNDFSGFWPSYAFIAFTTKGMRYHTRSLAMEESVFVPYASMRTNLLDVSHETRFVAQGQASYTEDRVHLSGRGPAKGLMTGRSSGWAVTSLIKRVQGEVDEVLG
ncbi:trypsin-like peptidase [Murinocardiopsis flavida]|uniref:Trypsin-like peptidase n=1 Tax=Murinocardiopsis flavida TaxID=645275 RepID=A0A2P8DKJ3_9ACTN|nr:trypsin-like peptidase domain-containing protein [Murinocardiopsis flavida]PSK97719.1 trypsin-like peptidase [Murinocardiopsis flavida]